MTNASSFFASRARRGSTAAALWWTSDLAGATAFAACLAFFINALARGNPSASYWPLLAALALSGGLRGLAQGLASIGGQRAANAMKGRLRRDVYRALLPTGRRRGKLAGEDLRTAVDDVEACEGYVARFLPLRRAAMATPLLTALIVAPASWVSALIMLATLVPFALGMALAGLAARKETERQFEALSRLSGLFVDRVRHLPIILAYNVEDRIVRQLGTAAREVADRTMQVLRVAFLSSAIMEFFAALSVALVAVYCGFSLLGLLPFPAPESLTLGRAFFALAMAPEFYLGMRRLAAAYHEKQQGEAAADAIGAALQSSGGLPAGRKQAPQSITGLSLERLAIGYGDGWRLGPLTAEWRGPGLHAITGETGAGKSSLLYALIGMAPVNGGRLFASGTEFAPGELNGSTGWASQRPLLLPGTLRSNLMPGSDPGGDTRLLETLEELGLGSLIGARGLDLAIDPRGSGLSGGERRRIGIARAALSGRPLLIFDEPTADLDDGNRTRVIAALARLARDRLVLVATHDRDLAGRADSETVLP
ncbi:MAG: ATP-binding cassette domain-containing protein [Novosphingobium sp.]|nr:ATP-binding cassette domain-containing protein [Novosphingobium sp.]